MIYRSVRIYGHYIIIKGNNVTFYRHLIRDFNFIEQEGREKWTAYKFVRNVYDIWVPLHLKRICSVIDELPFGINFDVSQAIFSSNAGSQSSQRSEPEYTEMPGEDDSQPSVVGSQEVTPTSSFTAITDRASKRSRDQYGTGQQR